MNYYGGNRVRDGIVRPLKATNFEELVRRYFDSPVPIALDRAEFLALPALSATSPSERTPSTHAAYPASSCSRAA